MKTKFITFCSLIFFALIHAAGSSIEGTITDSRSSEPLMGANIMLDGTMLGAASDENGHYLITNIPIGSYTLKAMFIGYETLEEKVRVGADSEHVIDLSLVPSAIKLQETTVTGEKRKGKITSAPASMEIVSSRDIKGKTTTNMGAYLKGLKGIDFTSSGINNYSISVRGFNSSFNTRLLTLSDGRVANIPALRVINYSTIPQSMDDVDKIEVIVGPATALYGANAHSGVVNIISKPPMLSEGLTMSISGSNDKRQLRKINGRFAHNLSNTISIKLSGMYLHAYDWPFISELEYKSHRYPWRLAPGRAADGKDNNPWNGEGNFTQLRWETNINGDSVRIGNGEQNHGDLDGDGVAGEDWYNGYDDDGDGQIDEDYFTADGIDNPEPYTDSNGNGKYDKDNNEPFEDWDNDGEWDNVNGEIDEDIDGVHDMGYDGVDNDHNGIIDDEAGGSIDGNIQAWGINIENNILIELGRKDSLINGEVNPFYIPDLPFDNNGQDLLGNHRYNEDKIILEFDIFTYDYGLDGLPGDPFIDLAGNKIYEKGEVLFGAILFDCGLDGLCPDSDGYVDPDYGEGDGIWQPGDAWVDENNNGIIDQISCLGEVDINFFCNDGYGTPDSYNINVNEDNFLEMNQDLYPFPNGVWDEGEEIVDCGNDGYCWHDSWTIGTPHQAVDINGQLVTLTNGDPKYIYGPDPGEGDGLHVWDDKENDGVFDIGDELFGFEGEPIINDNGNGILDPNENYIDTNNDGQYNAPDLIDDYHVVLDTNGDGMDDFPDFEIDNRKLEFRIDYDPNPDFNLTFQSGYSWTKTQQVTGTGRYLADGFEYEFYQLRGRYKNWFSQFYMNQSFSGDTRGYNLGNRIIDKSKNYAYQIQHNFKFPAINSKFVWGLDYFRTEPNTNGTIINDGPNGYDNDGDNVIIGYNGLDEDGDGEADDPYCPDGLVAGFRNGKIWECGEGIDEPDEFIDPTSNEYGIYYQSTTELFGTTRYELITAARLDYHDLLDEGLLFAPKLGFIYKPNFSSSMRFTYGKAYNTPNSISLFTDLFVGKNRFSEIYLRGNYKGTEYCRVGSPCLGEDYPTSVAIPGFYGEDNSTFYTFGPTNNTTYFEGYPERVAGAPYYFQFDGDNLLSGDNIPLDTLKNIIFVPELNGDGVLYTTEESINIPDIDPIRTEKIQTLEFGYKGFLGKKTHFTLDYYLSYYEDFFSPPTIITPLVVSRMFDENGNEITNIDDIDDLSDLNVQGIMNINDAATYPPYATAFNGIDDDGDWAEWADDFGWGDDDKDGDGNFSDPGEWGFIVFDYDDGSGNVIDTAFFHPWEVMQNKDGFPSYQVSGVGAYIYNRHGVGYTTAGVDEWTEFGALREIETVEGANSITGEALNNIGITSAPYHLVLSPMNYGEVWMQGCDIGFTHFLSDKLIFDGNVSWYGTTEFYNKLTKKNDPINAPKWKGNASLKWNFTSGNVIINLRSVEAFKWSDGIWSGIIGPYNILDLFYTYHITDNLDINISALNLNNDIHKELIGGAVMGKQIIMRFTSTF